MPRMPSSCVTWSRWFLWGLAFVCFGALATSTAHADDREVVVPETTVRSAPVDVAPEMARLHAGDRVHGDDQTQGPWRRVALPNGRYGFVRDADTRHSSNPVSIPANEPRADQSAPAPASSASGQAAPVLVQRQASSEAEAGPHLLGVMFELLPVGTLATTSPAGSSASFDSVFAVGVAPFLDGALSPYFTLGLSPQVIFRVKGDGSTNESAKEIDLRARLTARAPLSSRVRAFGRVSPAYSIILLPSPPSTNGNTTTSPANPQGFLLGVSVGVEVAVLPNLILVTDVGYQAGFQSSSDGDLHTSYLHLGAGFAIGL